MATRAERVKEALDHISGHEKVAFALAINDQALRRDYFNAVCGFDETTVVKTLAKLANDSIVGETDGLLFHVASKEVAKDVLEYMPAETGKELHAASLDWADAREADQPDPRFLIHHLIGAEEFKQAAEMLLDCREQEEDPVRAKSFVKPLRLTFEGLMRSEDCDLDQCISLALAVCRDGYGLLKPKVITEVFSALVDRDLNAAQLAAVTEGEAWIKEERSRSRAAAKAAAKALAQETEENAVHETTP